MACSSTGSATSVIDNVDDSIHEVEHLQPVESNDERESGPFLRVFPWGEGLGEVREKGLSLQKNIGVLHMHILEISSGTSLSQLKSRSTDSVATAHFQI